MMQACVRHVLQGDRALDPIEAYAVRVEIDIVIKGNGKWKMYQRLDLPLRAGVSALTMMADLAPSHTLGYSICGKCQHQPVNLT